MRANTKAIAQLIATIAEEDWVSIVYPEGGEAAVSETTYYGRHLVVRRTRLLGLQAAPWPEWRHFAFLSDLSASAVEANAFHRERAQAARHSRPEGGGGRGAPPIGRLRCQRGLALLRRFGPQPAALDPAPGRTP